MNLRKAKRIAAHLKLLRSMRIWQSFHGPGGVQIITYGNPLQFRHYRELESHIERTKINLRRVLGEDI